MFLFPEPILWCKFNTTGCYQASLNLKTAKWLLMLLVGTFLKRRAKYNVKEVYKKCKWRLNTTVLAAKVRKEILKENTGLLLLFKLYIIFFKSIDWSLAEGEIWSCVIVPASGVPLLLELNKMKYNYYEVLLTTENSDSGDNLKVWMNPV